MQLNRIDCGFLTVIHMNIHCYLERKENIYFYTKEDLSKKEIKYFINSSIYASFQTQSNKKNWEENKE